VLEQLAVGVAPAHKLLPTWCFQRWITTKKFVLRRDTAAGVARGAVALRVRAVARARVVHTMSITSFKAWSVFVELVVLGT